MRRSLLFLPVWALACAGYDPPPGLEASSIEKGLYDPSQGPLRLSFDEPVVPRSIELTLRLDRRGTEGEPCTPGTDGHLPAGCQREAAAVLGPCAADAAHAKREETGTRYTCPGGSMLVSADRRSVVLDPEATLIPFEAYTVSFAPGIEGDSGRRREVLLRVSFQVSSAFPLQPTDFGEGMFFAVFDIRQPIASQFHFYIWFAVKPETGELRLFGSDIDPNDPSVDAKTNRDPAAWHPDPTPPTGTAIRAAGQVAQPGGARALRVFPFTLDVAVPRVEALSSELSGLVERRRFEGAPGDEREVIAGQLYSPTVFLGDGSERAALGEARGVFSMFRLRPEEVPPLATILPPDVSLEQVLAPFGP